MGSFSSLAHGSRRAIAAAAPAAAPRTSVAADDRRDGLPAGLRARDRVAAARAAVLRLDAFLATTFFVRATTFFARLSFF